MEFSKQLEEIMAQRNFHIKGTIDYAASGEWQRFPDATKEGKRNLDLFVIIHDGDRGASFGDWHYPNDWCTYWNSNYSGKPTVTEIRNMEVAREERKYEQRLCQIRQEKHAQKFWDKPYLSLDAGLHQYVIEKKIKPYLSRKAGKWLVIPIRDINYNLVTLQLIRGTFKRVWKGTTYKNYMIWLCDKLPSNYEGVIRICEGYSTGCTIRAITNSPVVCAINAHNIYNIAELLKQRFPYAMLKVCADNDQWGIENTGLAHASFTSRRLGLICYVPDFTGLDVSKKPTDFNDLYALTNREVVKRQLILIRK